MASGRRAGGWRVSCSAERAIPVGTAGVCVCRLWAVRPDRILYGSMVATVVAVADEGGVHCYLCLGHGLVLATEAGREEVNRAIRYRSVEPYAFLLFSACSVSPIAHAVKQIPLAVRIVQVCHGQGKWKKAKLSIQ